MLKVRIKQLLKLSLVVVILNIFLFYLLREVLISKTIRKTADHHGVNLSHVIVHLDLKGAPPKLSYLNKLLPMLKEQGATGLLVEYEDMFPYEGKLTNLSAKNCYRRDELRKFLYSAKSMGLELIPLIQTFGHMESALKLREYQHLREQTDYPDSICPSRVESRNLITNMLDQVLTFHKSVHRLKFVHVGCDEVFHINICGACRRRMLNTEEIFLQHVMETSTFIIRDHPGVTVLIWDDMLRGIPPLILNQYPLRKYVEPVVWDYRSIVDIRHLNVFKYYKNFNNIWISSAFKGASRKATAIPDINRRHANHMSWMKAIKGYKMSGRHEIFNFRGIFLTGWSRFSHFDTLCEVLPVSIPSLLVCLITVQEFIMNGNIDPELIDGNSNLEGEILKKLYVKLNCMRNGKVGRDNIATKCIFDEVNLYKSIIEMTSVMNSVIENEKDITFNGDLLNFYIENQHVNPNELLKIKSKFEYFETKLNTITSNVTNYMTPYFDNYIIEEYVKSKMYIKDIVKDVLDKVHIVSKLKTWERGPVMSPSNGKYYNEISNHL